LDLTLTVSNNFMAPEGEPDLNRRKFMKGAVSAAVVTGLGMRALKARAQDDVEVKRASQPSRIEGLEDLKNRNTTTALEITLLLEMQDVDIEQINHAGGNPSIMSFYETKDTRAKAAAAIAAIAGAAGGALVELGKQVKRDILQKSNSVISEPIEDAKDERNIKSAAVMGGLAVGALATATVLLTQPREENYKAAQENFNRWIDGLRHDREGKAEVISRSDIENRIQYLSDKMGEK
jgi:hypothetical protein